MADADAFLAKAAESLASAEDDYAKGRYNSCARNAYYAAFQAAVAALLAEGIRPRERWEHEFVQARFAGVLVYRRKLYAPVFRSLLATALKLRGEADYSVRPTAQRIIARRLSEVRALVSSVKERLDGNR